MATLHYGNIIKKYLNLKNNEIQSNIQDTTYKNPKKTVKYLYLSKPKIPEKYNELNFKLNKFKYFPAKPREFTKSYKKQISNSFMLKNFKY